MMVRLDGSSDIPRRHNLIAIIYVSAHLAKKDWVLSKNKFMQVVVMDTFNSSTW